MVGKSTSLAFRNSIHKSFSSRAKSQELNLHRNERLSAYWATRLNSHECGHVLEGRESEAFKVGSVELSFLWLKTHHSERTGDTVREYVSTYVVCMYINKVRQLVAVAPWDRRAGSVGWRPLDSYLILEY